MKNVITSIATTAAVVTVALASASAVHAGGHGAVEVAVPANLCPETKDMLARWAHGKPAYTAYAVPTSKNSECGQKGERVTAGIAQADDVNEARRAALEVCDAHRGSFGPCTIIATVRPKQ